MLERRRGILFSESIIHVLVARVLSGSTVDVYEPPRALSRRKRRRRRYQPPTSVGGYMRQRQHNMLMEPRHKEHGVTPANGRRAQLRRYSPSWSVSTKQERGVPQETMVQAMFISFWPSWLLLVMAALQAFLCDVCNCFSLFVFARASPPGRVSRQVKNLRDPCRSLVTESRVRSEGMPGLRVQSRRAPFCSNMLTCLYSGLFHHYV